LSDKHDDAAADLLIQEVDEELRHDQFNLLWKKYGNLAAAAAVALVLAVTGWQGWQAWDGKQRQASSLRYAEAAAQSEQGKRDEAAQVLADLSKDGTAGYRILADLKRANLREAAGDHAGASTLYHALAERGGVDALYRDIARLKAAYLDLDGSDPAQVEKLVEPLTQETSPWRHSAREVLALAALKRGDDAKAAELFRKLADDIAAPQGIRARAAEMLATGLPAAAGAGAAKAKS
jgi:hypothetical protein